VTSIAAGGTAPGDELLAPEGHAAIAAVTGLDANSGFIDKHFFIFQCKGSEWASPWEARVVS
jgi:hypothetical protein